jgi:DNA polymerase I-like protein with 3'-5' exonuclease and polymerase domains
MLDIETNLSWDTIWFAVVMYPSGLSTVCNTVAETHRALSGIDCVIGHNLIAFDLPRMKEIWNFEWNRNVIDTLVLSRLLEPSILGGHSLASCAKRAGGSLKEDFDTADFDRGDVPEIRERMTSYCIADCAANLDVYKDLLKKKDAYGFSDESYDIEAEVRKRTTVQEQNGFLFDFPRACEIHTQHQERMEEIEHELQEVFPPIVEQRWSEKTGKPLKDKVTAFNPGSRQQVASRLEDKGAVWKTFTETGKPKVDETTLKELSHIPEAVLVLEYLTLSKRIGMVKSWIDNTAEDGRIHGNVNTCGAVTGRMTHSKPNLAQIPSESDYRELFIVPEGCDLVGVDASGLELRMLAHYMQDDDYTSLILDGDIHSYNQEAAGLPTRDNAKTFIYGFLYGAGDAKIGEIVGGGAKQGATLKRKFLQSLPALRRLLERVGLAAGRGHIKGLDGRRIHVRSQHAALNSLLQSAGAVVMKKALIIAATKLDSYGYPYKLVAQVHDEFQIEVPKAYSERVAVVFRNAIRQAGRDLDMRCPLDGDYQIGPSWADTH